MEGHRVAAHHEPIDLDWALPQIDDSAAAALPRDLQPLHDMSHQRAMVHCVTLVALRSLCHSWPPWDDHHETDILGGHECMKFRAAASARMKHSS